MSSFEDGGGESRLGQVGGRHQAVVSAAHDTHVILALGGTRAQPPGFTPQERVERTTISENS
jgi:hypothetical protein